MILREPVSTVASPSHSFSSPPATLCLTPTAADAALMDWYDRLGIDTWPGVQVVTTSHSVGGRGVFNTARHQPIAANTVIASIPNGCVLHAASAATCFPLTRDRLQQCFRRRLTEQYDMTDKENGLERNNSSAVGWFQNLWNKVLWRATSDDETSSPWDHDDDDSLWTLELAEYALTACETHHPWAEWIQTWQRDDVLHEMLCKGTQPSDVPALERAADALHQIMPDLNVLTIQAALSMRLATFQRLQSLVRDRHDAQLANLYSLISSRALQIDKDVTGVVPLHDMVNHSLQPNLEIVLQEDCIQLVTVREIAPSEELFLQYTKLGEPMDKLKALWTLIQWGIPTDPSEYLLSGKTDRHKVMAKPAQ